MHMPDDPARGEGDLLSLVYPFQLSHGGHMAYDKKSRRMLVTATWLNSFGHWQQADKLIIKIINRVVEESPDGQESKQN